MPTQESSTTEDATRKSQRGGRTVESLETWSAFFNGAVVVLTAVLAVAGFFAWKYSSELVSLKDEALTRYKAEADAKIAEANAQSSEANTKAESFRLAIATAEDRAANANRIAEEERMARVKIEEGLTSRRITKEHQATLAIRLTSFSGQTVHVWFNAGDHESFIFASDITATLEAAQWDVYAPASKISMLGSGRRGPSSIEVGVVVMSTGDNPSGKASATLVQELLALGFDAVKSPRTENRTAPTVIVHVETRPTGAQGAAKLRRKT
jgi:hypothetical protein